jgi:Tfp pilus assembly protein PilO
MDFLDKLINWIPLLANALIMLGGWYILWRKAKPEIDKTDAEARSEDANAAEASATAVKLYAEELTSVRKELKELRAELDSRDSIILDLKTVLDDTKDWAERLSHQVISLGAVPVKFRSTRNLSKEIIK